VLSLSRHKLLLKLTDVALLNCDVTVKVIVVAIYVVELSVVALAHIIISLVVLVILLHLVVFLHLIFFFRGEKSLVLANTLFFLALCLSHLELLFFFFTEFHSLLTSLAHELLVKILNFGAQGSNLLDKLHIF
jgi:hypothetical protein